MGGNQTVPSHTHLPGEDGIYLSKFLHAMPGGGEDKVMAGGTRPTLPR
jgi:hypothetical protein